MRVAITGVASRLGSELVAALERDPVVTGIVGLDRTKPARISGKLRFCQRDVRDPRLHGDLAGCDALLHLAFMFQPPLPPLSEVFSVNVDGSRNVFDCAVRSGVRKILFASSIAVYGAFEDNPVPITEEHPIRLMAPTFYYNDCKVRVERILDELEAGRSGLVITRLRPCTIAGRQHSHMLSRRVLATTGPDVPVQFVWVDDLVSAFCLALAKDAPGAFNVAGDTPMSFRQIAARTGKRCLGLPYGPILALAELSWRLGLQRNLPPGWIRMSRYPVVVSCDRAKRILGWTPRQDTLGAVKQFLEHRGAPARPSLG